jgi:hypothetical protein
MEWGAFCFKERRIPHHTQNRKDITERRSASERNESLVVGKAI